MICFDSVRLRSGLDVLLRIRRVNGIDGIRGIDWGRAVCGETLGDRAWVLWTFSWRLSDLPGLITKFKF
jgi:hypothetical protein